MITEDVTESASAPIRVLIADDHITVLEGLAAIIGRQADMSVVAQASDGLEAVAMWQAHRPQVTLLDLRMPLLDGVGAIEEIRRKDASAPILVLTTFDTDADVSRAVRAGALGYILKDSPREMLLDAIRRVHLGETAISQALVGKLAAGISNDALTGRELEVLSLLAKGYSNKAIGGQLFISQSTVKSHLHSIFTKLNVLSRTEAIAVANERGILAR